MTKRGSYNWYRNGAIHFNWMCRRIRIIGSEFKYEFNIKGGNCQFSAAGKIRNEN